MTSLVFQVLKVGTKWQHKRWTKLRNQWEHLWCSLQDHRYRGVVGVRDGAGGTFWDQTSFQHVETNLNIAQSGHR